MTSNDDIITDTLAWVNQVRSERGMPTLAQLPAGRCGSHDKCPVARALTGTGADRVSVAHDVTFYFGGTAESLPLPYYVGEFIEAFDEELFPELIEAPEVLGA